MAQRPEEITNLLQDALHTQQEVAINTIDRHRLKGRVIDIEAATVKPYNERGVITVETGRGAKQSRHMQLARLNIIDCLQE